MGAVAWPAWLARQHLRPSGRGHLLARDTVIPWPLGQGEPYHASRCQPDRGRRIQEVLIKDRGRVHTAFQPATSSQTSDEVWLSWLPGARIDDRSLRGRHPMPSWCMVELLPATFGCFGHSWPKPWVIPAYPWYTDRPYSLRTPLCTTDVGLLLIIPASYGQPAAYTSVHRYSTDSWGLPYTVWYRLLLIIPASYGSTWLPWPPEPAVHCCTSVGCCRSYRFTLVMDYGQLWTGTLV